MEAIIASLVGAVLGVVIVSSFSSKLTSGIFSSARKGCHLEFPATPSVERPEKHDTLV